MTSNDDNSLATLISEMTISKDDLSTYAHGRLSLSDEDVLLASMEEQVYLDGFRYEISSVKGLGLGGEIRISLSALGMPGHVR